MKASSILALTLQLLAVSMPVSVLSAPSTLGSASGSVQNRVVLKKFDPIGESHVFGPDVHFATPSSLFTAKTVPRLSSLAASEAIVLKLTCGASVTAARCDSARATMKASLKRIANAIKIDAPVIVDAEYVSFCNDPSKFITSQEQRDVLCKRGILGAAAPFSFHKFPSTTIPAQYDYPQALVKQLILQPQKMSNPNATFSFTDSDIYALFNADAPFSFTGATIAATEFDLELTFLHEIFHGLGFLSSMTLLDAGLVAPGINLDDTKEPNVFYFADPNIFDYFAYDSRLNRPFYSTIFSTLRANTITDFETAFFANKQLADYSRACFNASTTAKGLEFRPSQSAITKVSGLKTGYTNPTILNTPATFSSGSSISHLDLNYYFYYSIEVLMLPSAPRGASLDQIVAFLGIPHEFGPRTLAIMVSLGYELTANSSLWYSDGSFIDYVKQTTPVASPAAAASPSPAAAASSSPKATPSPKASPSPSPASSGSDTVAGGSASSPSPQSKSSKSAASRDASGSSGLVLMSAITIAALAQLF